jgi:hypothetical protein
MGWRFWAPDKSDAEKSLQALQQGSTKGGGKVVPAYEDEIFVTLTETPVDRAPRSPLSVVNEGRPVHVGDRVQLATTLTTQETSIVSITRDGVPCTVLELDEHGVIVLDDAADLTDVYRTSYLLDAGSTETQNDSGFLVQVHTAEQRGKDVYVVGAPRGAVVLGGQTVVSPWTDPDRRFVTMTSVDHLPDGRVGVLLAKRDASTIEYGDEIMGF